MCVPYTYKWIEVIYKCMGHTYKSQVRLPLGGTFAVGRVRLPLDGAFAVGAVHFTLAAASHTKSTMFVHLCVIRKCRRCCEKVSRTVHALSTLPCPPQTWFEMGRRGVGATMGIFTNKAVPPPVLFAISRLPRTSSISNMPTWCLDNPSQATICR